MSRTSLLVAAGLVLASLATSVPATRLVGDAGGMTVHALTALPSGGWAVAGTVAGGAGDWDGLVLAINVTGAPAWAMRAAGRRLYSIAPLPDGGVLVAGAEGLVARLDPAGRLIWQVEWGGRMSWLRAAACSGWECAVGGNIEWRGVIAFIDGATGAVRLQADSVENIPQRLAWAGDGSLVVGGIVQRDEMAQPVVARLERDGTTRWARALDQPDWQYAQEAIADIAVTALAIAPDTTIVALRQDIYGQGAGVSLRDDGVVMSGFLTGGTLPRGAIITDSGAVIVASRGSRLEAFMDGVPVHAVRLVSSPGWPVDVVRLADGSLITLQGALVAILDLGLSSLDGCPAIAPDWLAQSSAPPDAGASSFDMALPPLVAPVPGSVLWTAACLGPCLVACEATCDDGIDDDANGAADCDDAACAVATACELADPDGDGMINRDDCAPSDATAGSVPGSALLTVTAWKWPGGGMPRLRWAPPRLTTLEPERPFADIVRGWLDDVRSTRTTASGTCVARRTPDGQWQDYAAGWSHDNLWYIVRPWNACGPGPWDSPDLEAAAPCP